MGVDEGMKEHKDAKFLVELAHDVLERNLGPFAIGEGGDESHINNQYRKVCHIVND